MRIIVVPDDFPVEEHYLLRYVYRVGHTIYSPIRCPLDSITDTAGVRNALDFLDEHLTFDQLDTP